MEQFVDYIDKFPQRTTFWWCAQILDSQESLDKVGPLPELAPSPPVNRSPLHSSGLPPLVLPNGVEVNTSNPFPLGSPIFKTSKTLLWLCFMTFQAKFGLALESSVLDCSKLFECGIEDWMLCQPLPCRWYLVTNYSDWSRKSVVAEWRSVSLWRRYPRLGETIIAML